MLSKYRAQNVWEQMKISLKSSGVPKLELVKVEGQGEAEAHLKDGDGVDNPKRRVVVLVLNSRVVLSAAESLV